jgi:alkaline phosphatase
LVGGGLSARAGAELDGVVLVISDATSQELITTTRIYSQGVKGRLALEDFPRAALVRTYSRSDMVTDSAAAATSLARGIKADNRVLGMETAGSTSGPESLLDVANAGGWSTGVGSDDSVTGATPAAFVVENGNRTENAVIASKYVQQLGYRADIVLGRGRRGFEDAGEDSAALDDIGEREVVAKTAVALKEKGVAIFSDGKALRSRVGSGDLSGPVLGLFAPNVFSYYADGQRELRLVDLTRMAVDFLQSKKRPFFLMVEAALPDKASHANHAKRAITEVLELDATLKYLRETLGSNVLILVTTDHATGVSRPRRGGSGFCAARADRPGLGDAHRGRRLVVEERPGR